VLLGLAGPARAQTAAAESAAPAGDGSPAAPAAAQPDDQVVPASCSSCSGGLLGGPSGGPGGCSGCGGGQCVPGREHCCSPCAADTCCGKILCGLYECICCPDPCYDPHWTALADSALFVDAARPVTQMRLRWDSQFGIAHPDRAEYFFAREHLDNNSGRGPGIIAHSIDQEEFSLYNEAALGRFGFFVEIPYREVDIYSSPFNGSGSGFGDMNLGTKSMLLDCELLQITFQFRTFLPIGDTGHGVGNGHVSLEPSLLFGLKLAPETYLQAQLSYWIPIGGDSAYEGNIFHAHASVNHLLWRILPDVQLIGTCEMSEWSVTNGDFTADDGTIARASASALYGGFGLRLNICDKIDFGVGAMFHLLGERWDEEHVRAEFRWRF
jgi:hypothetical protein